MKKSSLQSSNNILFLTVSSILLSSQQYRFQNVRSEHHTKQSGVLVKPKLQNVFKITPHMSTWHLRKETTSLSRRNLQSTPSCDPLLIISTTSFSQQVVGLATRQKTRGAKKRGTSITAFFGKESVQACHIHCNPHHHTLPRMEFFFWHAPTGCGWWPLPWEA